MGYEDLQAIYQRQEEDYREWLEEDPTECPKSGHALETGPNGELHCPFDGWIWDGDPRNKA